MEIPAVMWSVVLFRYVDKNENKSCEHVFSITKKANLSQFSYLEKDYPYSDTIWEVANSLKNINLETNKELKEIFFKSWKEVQYEDKLRVFKNVDYQEFKDSNNQKFEKQLKLYYLENMIEYPTVSELFRFRKDLSQEKLKIGMVNIIKQIKFLNIKNQPNNKIDYWENHLTGKESNKLLDLLELSGSKKEELLIFENIGFLNTYRQAKFDKINEKEADVPLVESEDKSIYLLEVKINTLMLLKHDDSLGSTFLNTALQYILILMEESLSLEKVNFNNQFQSQIKFIAYDKESYDFAVLKREAISQWMENNTSLLINKIKDVHNKNKSAIEIREDIKTISEKIILKNKLESNLVEKNIITKNKNKI